VNFCCIRRHFCRKRCLCAQINSNKSHKSNEQLRF